MQAKDFIAPNFKHHFVGKKVISTAPSNIALVKYWGKYDQQLPTNASISFTLNTCKTITEIHVEEKNTTEDFNFQVYFEGKLKPDFKPKIESFLKKIEVYSPFLKDYKFSIHTKNTFPHSSGIASSASGLAALAKCIVDLEQSANQSQSADYYKLKTSFLARLGSGSACRSTHGNLVVWGQHSSIPESSNLYGIEFPFEVHEKFKNFCDSILLVDKGQKQVSSSVGHQLMYQHPFAEQRFKQANENLTQLTSVLQNGNYKDFFSLVETEALSLHAMMMTSKPYFILMRPNTLQIIEAIWDFRNSTQTPLGFTLDAGANVHLLYPKSVESEVKSFIKNSLASYCQNKEYIHDQVTID